MNRADRRFQFRYQADFMALVDDWRRRQPQIPSRSLAIRLLALRGVSVEADLAMIVEHMAGELADASIITAGADREVYKRFQEVVVRSLDDAARLRLAPVGPQAASAQAGADAPSVPERRDRDIAAPKTRQDSR